MTKFLRLNLQMFGASASNSTSLNSSGGSHPYTLTASFVENSTDTINNRSNVSVTATLKANGTYWTTSYSSTLEIYWYDNRTGTESLKDSITFKGLSGYYDSKSVTATFNVDHKTDGTLSGYAKAYFTKGSTTSTSAPASGNVATPLTSLKSIARVSGVSCTNTNVGGTASIYISRADASYTDTITYTIGSLTGTIATRTNQNQLSFDTSSLTSSIYAQMGASNKTITGTITIQTFNGGGTSLGTNSTTFTLSAVENDCKPLVDVAITTTDTLSATLTGNTNTIIKDISSTSISYTITPRNGASITSKWATGYSDLTASPITDWLIYMPTFEVNAIDTRNYQGTKTITLGFVDYFVPTATIQGYRTSPTGSEIKASFQGTFFNDTFGAVNNSLTLVIKYKVSGGSTWTTLRTLVENTDYTIDDNTFYSGTGSVATDITLDNSVFNYQNSYDIGLFYADQIVDTNIMTQVPKGVPAFNWDDNLLNVNGNLTISDTDGNNPVNVLNEINTINSSLIEEDTTYIPVTQSTSNQLLWQKSLNKGIYLFICNLAVNYYGANGRDLYTYLYLNGTQIDLTDGVINISAYSLYRPVIKIINVTSDSSTLRFEVSSTSGNYLVGVSQVQLMRLK